MCPNLDILVPALVEGSIDELEKRCALTPGILLCVCSPVGLCFVCGPSFLLLWLCTSHPAQALQQAYSLPLWQLGNLMHGVCIHLCVCVRAHWQL